MIVVTYKGHSKNTAQEMITSGVALTVATAAKVACELADSIYKLDESDADKLAAYLVRKVTDDELDRYGVITVELSFDLEYNVVYRTNHFHTALNNQCEQWWFQRVNVGGNG